MAQNTTSDSDNWYNFDGYTSPGFILLIVILAIALGTGIGIAVASQDDTAAQNRQQQWYNSKDIDDW